MMGFPTLDDEVERQLGYVPPSEANRIRHQEVTAIFLEAGRRLAKILPPGADATLAIRELARARMAANAAIACCLTMPFISDAEAAAAAVAESRRVAAEAGRS